MDEQTQEQNKTLITRSAEETERVGRTLAAFCPAGTVVLLDGELAAGKTVFAKGFGKGLGVTEHIKSPSYTLMLAYEGRLPFYHFDAYNLQNGAGFCALGFDEYWGGEGVCLIEWASVIRDAWEDGYIRVHILPGETEDQRRITVYAQGAFHEKIIREWWEHEASRL